MATYTVRILNKGQFRKQTTGGSKLYVFGEFELIGESYRDRVEMRKDEFTIPGAKALIEAKIIKFLDERFDPIEYTVNI